MADFTNNYKTIKDIYGMFKDGELYIDNGYQRRSVWGERDKTRLIETILLGYLMPELFLWKAETDPETGKNLVHIVDGQQRISAIIDFLNDELELKAANLMSNEAKTRFGGRFFKNIDSSDRTNVWDYRLTVVEISSVVTKEKIAEMFRRLNLTEYNLNSQERRNSISGEFDELARELSCLDIWDEYELFKSSDIKRMKDVQFCATLLILYKRGIIEQNDEAALNQAYEDYYANYVDAENDKNAFVSATDILIEFLSNKDNKKFLKRKSQLYTMFSIVFYAMREGIDINADITNRFTLFVSLYSKFINGMSFSEELSPEEKEIFDVLNRYKLASSEGINKYTNRMLRYNIMRGFLFEFSDNQITAQNKLSVKMAGSNGECFDLDDVTEEE